MIRRALFIAVIALLLAACGTRENAALQREVDRLRAERDKNAMIAENLDEYKAQVARLQDDLATTESMGVLLAHDKRVERAAAVPGVVKVTMPGGGWEITGSPRETMYPVFVQGGALAVDHITFDAAGWKLKIPANDYQAVDRTYGVQIPPPTPAPGRYQSARTKNLRSEIHLLNRELAELERLIGEIKQFETKKAEAAARMRFLNTPSRLSTQLELATRLFLADGAPCVTGALTFSRESVRLFCAPRGKDHEASAVAIRALFPPDTRLTWKIGPLSIDERSAEPIQASLTYRH